MTRPAFLTGSRAYGTPREDSDVDLVVLVEPSAPPSIVPLARYGEAGVATFCAFLLRVNAEREAAELARADRLEPVAADGCDCTGDTT